MADEKPPREWLAKNDHIPDEELARDIADTEREIVSCRKVGDAYAILVAHDFTRPNQKAMHRMRAEQAATDILSGLELLEKLKALRQWRDDGRPPVPQKKSRGKRERGGG